MPGTWIRAGLAGFAVAVLMSVWAVNQIAVADMLGTQRTESEPAVVADFDGFDVITLEQKTDSVQLAQAEPVEPVVSSSLVEPVELAEVPATVQTSDEPLASVQLAQATDPVQPLPLATPNATTFEDESWLDWKLPAAITGGVVGVAAVAGAFSGGGSSGGHK